MESTFPTPYDQACLPTTASNDSDIPTQRQSRANHHPINDKPTIIGLYGIPGAGKTTLAESLKRVYGEESFAFFEGSVVIAGLVPGGLAAFKQRGEQAKIALRQQAIMEIKRQCASSGKVGVVTGHYMFWDERQATGNPVCTEQDLDTFTHIIYLDVTPSVIAQRIQNDTRRTDRPSSSEAHMHRWQEVEKCKLKHLCHQSGTLLYLVGDPTDALGVVEVIDDFTHHSETVNISLARDALDRYVATREHGIGTMLLIDGDRTLSAQDTGSMFWAKAGIEDPLKALFSSPLGYSYTAFRQATLLYENFADNEEFDALCEEVASEVSVQPEFLQLLQCVADQAHIGVIVLTCGIRRVWEKVVEKAGMSHFVTVIGGGRLADSIVVTPSVKEALVVRLQTCYGTHVWAFGDSPLDLPMLKKADRAIVVVGEVAARSRTMDKELQLALDDSDLDAHQLLLPSTAAPRLTTVKLPVTHIADILSLFGGHLEVFHNTDKPANKLMMTPTRDANVAGPALRAAHRNIGWYLATEIMSEVVGLEEVTIQHVQGMKIAGHRLLEEEKTAIVALMRGGEPLAFGVNDAFPLAKFVHAHRPTDITFDDHLKGLSTVVLVDSVINSGKTVVQFVRHLRKLHTSIRIIVLAGVVQAESVREGGSLVKGLAGLGRVTLIALRLSENKYTGSGGTDTGNRLFNTTNLLRMRTGDKHHHR